MSNIREPGFRGASMFLDGTITKFTIQTLFMSLAKIGQYHNGTFISYLDLENHNSY
jgi:hypothetical protein